MASSVGRILLGQKASYKLLSVLKEPSVFKAAIVPWAGKPPGFAPNTPVVVKDLCLERGLRAHQIDDISACPFIRQALDHVEKSEHDDWSPSKPSIQKRIVFEWMDTDLWRVRPFGQPFDNPKLPQIVAGSILEALVVFHRLRSVHTDVNPNNIFLSNLDDKPIVKLGDLDNAFYEGVAKHYTGAQTDETRAPEVWKGLGVWHSSDTWVVGNHSTIFGPRDKIIQDNKAAWCLGKIFRLVGPAEIPESPNYTDNFELAAALENGATKLSPEICSPECIDFIEHLLIIDPAKRSTAEEALQHPFVKATTL